MGIAPDPEEIEENPYHQVVKKKADERGYLLWNAGNKSVIQSFMIPRGFVAGQGLLTTQILVRLLLREMQLKMETGILCTVTIYETKCEDYIIYS